LFGFTKGEGAREPDGNDSLQVQHLRLYIHAGKWLVASCSVIEADHSSKGGQVSIGTLAAKVGRRHRGARRARKVVHEAGRHHSNRLRFHLLIVLGRGRRVGLRLCNHGDLICKATTIGPQLLARPLQYQEVIAWVAEKVARKIENVYWLFPRMDKGVDGSKTVVAILSIFILDANLVLKLLIALQGVNKRIKRVLVSGVGVPDKLVVASTIKCVGLSNVPLKASSLTILRKI
jgi:hypothetical protein